MASVQQVADRFIRRAHEVGDPITNLKLQKLVYYAQAWYATLNEGQPLFPEPFEAWVHGPVCPPLYDRFRAYQWRPIDENVGATDLPADVCDHLDEVLAAYGNLTAYTLERLTHQEEPWRQARGDLPPDARCTNVIPVEAMVAFYSRQLASGAEV